MTHGWWQAHTVVLQNITITCYIYHTHYLFNISILQESHSTQMAMAMVTMAVVIMATRMKTITGELSIMVMKMETTILAVVTMEM